MQQTKNRKLAHDQNILLILVHYNAIQYIYTIHYAHIQMHNISYPNAVHKTITFLILALCRPSSILVLTHTIDFQKKKN